MFSLKCFKVLGIPPFQEQRFVMLCFRVTGYAFFALKLKHKDLSGPLFVHRSLYLMVWPTQQPTDVFCLPWNENMSLCFDR